ncbi:hypothetical protein PC129_g13015 [Phytophthora cactorum]|uniref:Uncharacterized protein n=1 Tax=Phytophthora cactorum TaxID=29920 RepID=A0A8T1C2K6_9STRA|nr:hypothetical protein PC114_g14308 [Phytophthora cactorum]KAG2911268.1 hypothetical protein PC115_g12607 [Phytophthora cactorum]KAG3216123.1 hypothetical protein PC129_g13015 [Phytophthora cactorum]KAG4242953.1 hypothetical protein PC116_g9162 [Phytophthora cactorum]
MSTSLSSPAVVASELESEEDSLDEESPIALALGAPAASSAAVKSLSFHFAYNYTHRFQLEDSIRVSRQVKRQALLAKAASVLLPGDTDYAARGVDSLECVAPGGGADSPDRYVLDGRGPVREGWECAAPGGQV